MWSLKPSSRTHIFRKISVISSDDIVIRNVICLFTKWCIFFYILPPIFWRWLLLDSNHLQTFWHKLTNKYFFFLSFQIQSNRLHPVYQDALYEVPRIFKESPPSGDLEPNSYQKLSWRHRTLWRKVSTFTLNNKDKCKSRGDPLTLSYRHLQNSGKQATTRSVDLTTSSLFCWWEGVVMKRAH